MLLKVGELAKRTGLTIRALHYYDNIGLLKPSGRSESGYRLYNQSDVARLHGIQALRRLGLPLAEISRLFEEGTASLPLIISRQIQALEHEMAKAAELRSRLLFIQEQIVAGIDPEIDAWLSTVGLMTTYGKYFSTDEIRKIVTNWNQLLAEWRPLITAIRNAMDRNMPVASVEVQTLARRWMDLSLRWMEGDFKLLKRWGNMCKEDPSAHGGSGIDAALFQYISMAIDLRAEALHRYLEPSQLMRMKPVAEEEWTALGKAAERMMQQGASIHSERVRRLAARWSNLVDQLTDNDPEIREKLLLAIRNEPILQSGMAISASAREFIRNAYRAAVPHAAVTSAKRSSPAA